MDTKCTHNQINNWKRPNVWKNVILIFEVIKFDNIQTQLLNHLSIHSFDCKKKLYQTCILRKETTKTRSNTTQNKSPIKLDLAPILAVLTSRLATFCVNRLFFPWVGRRQSKCKSRIKVAIELEQWLYMGLGLRLLHSLRANLGCSHLPNRLLIEIY